jgi:hypothetical protein
VRLPRDARLELTRTESSTALTAHVEDTRFGIGVIWWKSAFDRRYLDEYVRTINTDAAASPIADGAVRGATHRVSRVVRRREHRRPVDDKAPRRGRRWDGLARLRMTRVPGFGLLDSDAQ